MRVYRLCRRPYADLSGEGGRLVSGRWHTAGRPVIYTAYEPALAVLEVRVHLDLPFGLLPDDYVLMEIEAAISFKEIDSLESDADPRAIGDSWLVSQTSAMLKVPSVLAPHGWNYLLNPQHPDAEKVSVSSVTPFKFDPRLWS
jgi:RES domain-containing protein